MTADPTQALTMPPLTVIVVTGAVVALAVLAIVAGLRFRRSDRSERLVQLDARISELSGAVARLNELVHGTQLESSRAFSDLAEKLTERQEALKREVHEDLMSGNARTQSALADSRSQFTETMHQHRLALEKRHSEALDAQAKALAAGLESVRAELSRALGQHGETIADQVKALTTMTDTRLKEIGGKVDQRLAEGFEKTTSTFTDIVKRLALIDEAQKKITELSSNVVSLQSILADKKSRGTFGEVQLEGLVRNVLPENAFAMQYRLGNDRIADCAVFLPEPTGTIAIDAKFPLESYSLMVDPERSEVEQRQAERQFKTDIKKHVADIADRYVVPEETADGAMMFIPAEAVFAEIQARHQDLVEEAHRRRVWMVSPTTLWAVLNTSRAVLKDAATREQVHVIQDHLRHLSKDFGRFRERMDKLSQHIAQANEDVRQVNISAQKIGSRFDKIEDVEIESLGSDARPTTPELKNFED